MNIIHIVVGGQRKSTKLLYRSLPVPAVLNFQIFNVIFQIREKLIIAILQEIFFFHKRIENRNIFFQISGLVQDILKAVFYAPVISVIEQPIIGFHFRENVEKPFRKNFFIIPQCIVNMLCMFFQSVSSCITSSLARK